MLYRLLNDLLALKKCCILRIEYLTSNKEIGYQALKKYNADKLNIACSFKI